ncbi:unnamed protein product, partial [Strongylus vulgaris]
MARVKFEYEPQHNDELRLGEIGQLITIIRKDCGDAGWFEGEINGRRGLFPDNFVELVQDLVVGQPGQVASKLTKSVVVTSGTESVATARPVSSIETEEASDDVAR